ncbi:MAG TPA: P1 family peptidase [Solirubrobacteraceae bacterium]|nr:P1 family peptidase [Solirubrobacteraceae bacterium]
MTSPAAPPPPRAPLPPGFLVGHGTDLEAATGCTVILAPPDGAVGGVEVRGGGPGTRETDLLSPATPHRPISAVVFSGGSARGLAVASDVAALLGGRGRGHRTLLGHLVPLVPAAVVYDMGIGADATPGPDAAREALDAATPEPARGTVGAGTGCSIGKLLGPEHKTKGGVGLASEEAGGCRVAALAVVNAIGDVLAEDGSVLAGPYRDGRYVRTVDVLRAGLPPAAAPGAATTLVCVMTDAAIGRLDAWLLARAATTGCARAIDPTATQFDGDACFVLAAGEAEADPLLLQAIVPHVVAAAIRDAARQATSLAGCEAVRDRAGR